jgi:hypothetical protein
MTRIVTTSYRYKRPPRKRKAVAIEVPAIVAAKRSRRPVWEKEAAAAEVDADHPTKGGGSAAKHTARGSTSHCSFSRQRRPQAGARHRAEGAVAGGVSAAEAISSAIRSQLGYQPSGSRRGGNGQSSNGPNTP